MPAKVSAPAYTREAPKPLPPHKRIIWDSEKGWQGITPADRAIFAAAAPAIDLDRQLSAADLWLRANPTKAKKQNFYRFFVNWIARQQERGGDTASSRNGAPREPQKSFAQTDREEREARRHGPEVIPLKFL